MWRMTLPNSGAPHQGVHPTMHKRLGGLKQVLGDAVKPQVARCSVCHIELEAVDITLGYCSDTEACTCRAYSARCW